MSEYRQLVEDLKDLRQGNGADEVILPMAEDEWYTRPDTVSYGIVSLDFEAGQMNTDDRKPDAAYEGSVDLFSMVRNGAGWPQRIRETLEEHCGGSWELNHHSYERETGLFHWEWTFQTLDTEAGDD